MKTLKPMFILLWIIMMFSFTLVNKKGAKKWYKGNTHTHTTISDGNASPEYVVNWYHERGYNFLVLTDHNEFVDPEKVKMPKDTRQDFILIPGEEVTGRKKPVHTTALNVNRMVNPSLEGNSTTEILQGQVDSVRSANGTPILNHPNYSTGVQVHEILPVKHLYMIELYNGHPHVNNWGKDSLHVPVEAKWDSLLSAGKHYYCVAADDAHHYDQFYDMKTNPGRGWVMVNSSELNADSIMAAMNRGDFYATCGVILKTIEIKNKTFNIEIDLEATKEELGSAYLFGNMVESEKVGFRIEYIGTGGELLQSTDGTSANYNIKNEEGYVRARAIYTRKRAKNHYEKLYAWTQPIFLD